MGREHRLQRPVAIAALEPQQRLRRVEERHGAGSFTTDGESLHDPQKDQQCRCRDTDGRVPSVIVLGFRPQD